MTEQEIFESLIANEPFRSIPGVRIRNVEVRPKVPFDVKFELQSGETIVTVYGEIKNVCSPKTAQEIAPWLNKMKALEPGSAFALICPSTSPETQAICLENEIDLIDLAGNVLVNIPGKFILQRSGQRSSQGKSPSTYTNPFSGRASRVIRVLLEKPQAWRTTEVLEELRRESERNPFLLDFSISVASVSRTLLSLEEGLLVRRRGSGYSVADPKRLLFRWAEKYKERLRYYRRSSFKTPNSLGSDMKDVSTGLTSLLGSSTFAFTGAASSSVTAPFVDIDQIEIFVTNPNIAKALRASEPDTVMGPQLRVTIPYDSGVFMYTRTSEGIPLVSDVQTFLDLYARGGRDLKQAEHLLAASIQPRWR